MFQRMILAVMGFALCMCLSTVARADDPKVPPNEALDKVLPHINFNGVPLVDVMEFLHDVTQSTINVDWDALKQAGVTKDVPVTVVAKDKTLRDVLTDILSKVQKDKPLDFAATKDAIKVSTKDALKK